MATRFKVCAAALLTAPVVLVGVGLAAPLLRMQRPLPVASIVARPPPIPPASQAAVTLARSGHRQSGSRTSSCVAQPS